jgi:hypothetical protein
VKDQDLTVQVLNDWFFTIGSRYLLRYLRKVPT